MQWNHSDLSGCAPRVGLAGRLLGKGGAVSKAEEPVDTHWTVAVVGARVRVKVTVKVKVKVKVKR